MNSSQNSLLFVRKLLYTQSPCKHKLFLRHNNEPRNSKLQQLSRTNNSHNFPKCTHTFPCLALECWSIHTIRPLYINYINPCHYPTLFSPLSQKQFYINRFNPLYPKGLTLLGNSLPSDVINPDLWPFKSVLFPVDQIFYHWLSNQLWDGGDAIFQTLEKSFSSCILTDATFVLFVRNDIQILQFWYVLISNGYYCPQTTPSSFIQY
jgi:hypothetical protein